MALGLLRGLKTLWHVGCQLRHFFQGSRQRATSTLSCWTRSWRGAIGLSAARGSEPKTLTILLLTGPYTSQLTDVALDIVEAALVKKYRVHLFLYMDGVHVPKRGQVTARFPNVEQRLRRLIASGMEVKCCVRCASARGYVEGSEDIVTGQFPTSQYLEGAVITEIYDFPRWVAESSKVISLGN